MGQCEVGSENKKRLGEYRVFGWEELEVVNLSRLWVQAAAYSALHQFFILDVDQNDRRDHRVGPCPLER